MIMSGLKSVVLTRGNASWRLIRFSDDCFVAKNGFGKQHVFRSGYEMTHFEDFLLAKGFTPLTRNRSLATLKKQAVA
jgi:hypothetical protein